MPEKKERLVIYAIDGNEDRRYWHEVGCAFVNEDGSLNVKLYMHPGVDLQIRKPNK